MNSGEVSSVFGRTGPESNLNTLDWVRTSKIKKNQQNLSGIVFYLKN